MDSEPLFKNDKAKENLVVVILSGLVFLEYRLNGRRAQVIVYLGVPVQQSFLHFAERRAAKPVIDNVHAKSPLLSSQDRGRKQ